MEIPINRLSIQFSEMDLFEKDTDKKIDLSNEIEYIGLFFTGSWCPPCREFEKILIDFYNMTNAQAKKFEVIHVCSEKNQKDFKESVKDLPWAIIKYNNNLINLITTELKIESIPMLIICTDQGDIITDEGRKDLMEDPNQAYSTWMKKYDELRGGE